MPPTIVRAAGLAISPWPNKAGRKADIASGPGWLVAFAWLDQDARFSDYAGHDRTITLIEGAGFVLRFDDGHNVAVAPATPTLFDGGLPLTCHLPHGPCRVLNVMTVRGKARHRARHRAQVARDGTFPPHRGPAVLVALAAGATLCHDGVIYTLGLWDSAVFENTTEIRTTGSFAFLEVTPVEGPC